MTREQAINYLRSSGMSEEQISTITESLGLQYKEGWDDGFECGIKIHDTVRADTIESYKKAFDDIRAEIKKASLGKWYVGDIKGKTEEVIVMEDVISIIDKHDPSKAEN